MLSYGGRYAMLLLVHMKSDHSRRHLFGALFISLLLHLLLVFGMGWVRPLPPTAQPAMQVVVTARPAAQVALEKQAAVSKALPPVSRRRQESPSPAVLTLERPAVSPDQGAPAPSAVLPEGGARETAAQVSPAAADAGSSAVAPESVSADGLRQYRIDLAVAARRFRQYPALARARGWEGVVELAVSVDAGLPSPSLRLVRSSGHEVLDEQALVMLSHAVAGTPLPDSLRHRNFVVPLPIRFSLEE